MSSPVAAKQVADEPTGRATMVHRDTNGEPHGVSLYLSANELRELGADLESDMVWFYVEDGVLCFE